MRKQVISIEDIARMAGVSHSTVSRALHDSPLISAEVRERIQHLAHEMGYIPNAIARSLQNQQTNMIGLVTTSISDPFFGDIVKGVEEVAQAANLSVVLGISHNDPNQEMGIIETFHQRRVDGIIIASSRITSTQQKRLNTIQIPTILINGQTDASHKSLHWVAVDDYKGARLAVEHLLALGHRSIGYLGTECRPRSNRQRLLGYQQALKDAGITPRPDRVVIAPGQEATHEEDVALGQAVLPCLLAAGVTALFCYNDMIAIGVLLACRERGIAVPDELSIIGFDDIVIAEFVTPPLSTIHQPKVELGHIATEMLLDLLNTRPVKDYILSPTLKVRASTTSLA